VINGRKCECVKGDMNFADHDCATFGLFSPQQLHFHAKRVQNREIQKVLGSTTEAGIESSGIASSAGDSDASVVTRMARAASQPVARALDPRAGARARETQAAPAAAKPAPGGRPCSRRLPCFDGEEASSSCWRCIAFNSAGVLRRRSLLQSRCIPPRRFRISRCSDL
jgi:hypothetical protein